MGVGRRETLFETSMASDISSLASDLDNFELTISKSTQDESIDWESDKNFSAHVEPAESETTIETSYLNNTVDKSAPSQPDTTEPMLVNDVHPADCSPTEIELPSETEFVIEPAQSPSLVPSAKIESDVEPVQLPSPDLSNDTQFIVEPSESPTLDSSDNTESIVEPAQSSDPNPTAKVEPEVEPVQSSTIATSPQNNPKVDPQQSPTPDASSEIELRHEPVEEPSLNPTGETESKPEPAQLPTPEVSGGSESKVEPVQPSSVNPSDDTKSKVEPVRPTTPEVSSKGESRVEPPQSPTPDQDSRQVRFSTVNSTAKTPSRRGRKFPDTPVRRSARLAAKKGEPIFGNKVDFFN